MPRRVCANRTECRRPFFAYELDGRPAELITRCSQLAEIVSHNGEMIPMPNQIASRADLELQQYVPDFIVMGIG